MSRSSPDELVVEHEAPAFLVDETARRFDADRDRIVAVDARPQRDASVERRQQRLEPQPAVTVGFGQRAAREVAAATELGEVRALGGDGGAHLGVVDRRRGARGSRRRRRGTRPPARPARPAAARPRDRRARRSGRRARAGRAPPPRATMASKPRRLLEPGRDVAAQLGEAEVGSQRRELRPPPHRSGADAPARRDLVERPPDERVARVPPLGHGGEHEARARSSAGRSLAECTATSARPSSTACSTSFTNTPVPPMAWIGTSRALVAPGGHDHVLRLDAEQLRRPVRPASGPARCRASPPAAAASTARRSGGSAARRFPRGRTELGRARRRTASPCAVPAASLTRTVGSCSSLLTSPRVNASTASCAAGSSAARRDRNRAQLGGAQLLGPGAQRRRPAARPHGPSARAGNGRAPR